METRNISLTIDKARDWYNSGNEALKEAALQAFTKKELEFSFRDIKTMLAVLTQSSSIKLKELNEDAEYLNENQKALTILSLIREVLNRGYDIKATEGIVYYPYNPLITSDSTYYDSEIKSGQLRKISQVRIEDKKYILLGGSANLGSKAGLLYFDSYVGVANVIAGAGFLGCATEEIAKHMSLYFAKEIFDAKYKGWLDYEWL